MEKTLRYGEAAIASFMIRRNALPSGPSIWKRTRCCLLWNEGYFTGAITELWRIEECQLVSIASFHLSVEILLARTILWQHSCENQVTITLWKSLSVKMIIWVSSYETDHVTDISRNPCSANHPVGAISDPASGNLHSTTILWLAPWGSHLVTAILWQSSCENRLWSPSCDSHPLIIISRKQPPSYDGILVKVSLTGFLVDQSCDN